MPFCSAEAEHTRSMEAGGSCAHRQKSRSSAMGCWVPSRLIAPQAVIPGREHMDRQKTC